MGDGAIPHVTKKLGNYLRVDIHLVTWLISHVTNQGGEGMNDGQHNLIFNSTTPIYLQIAQHIREQILDGQLTAGSQIMSTTQYATTYRINPATANKAFNLLQSEGLIFKQRGIGMFVTDDATAILKRRGQESYLRATLGPAIAAGRSLGFTNQEITTFVDALLEEEQ
ncbi:DNA-binding transcriptional regulator YhcF, GntR family [Arcanobacterium phocae]|uniref:DNA-binding transcriptional regulator YhcF, GntR family n=2 Tax=Arcanobacterium phocae TaxID=131112 RepID=A0A1H2L9T9_9ACTO|nr:DNA-binding transcriptional regulator YhcF, GntR family [Arcanobacterium phocae]